MILSLFLYIRETVVELACKIYTFLRKFWKIYKYSPQKILGKMVFHISRLLH